jgi:hypothetical protein
MQNARDEKDTTVNTCSIICDDGWFIKAPTYAEAKALAIDHLVSFIGEIDEIEAEALFDHDIGRGIIQIIHRTRGTHNVH